MIYFMRSMNVTPGKFQEYLAWVQKLAAYFNKTYPGHNAQNLTNIGGPVFQMHWLHTHDSLADFDTLIAALNSDAEWQALFAEGDGLYDSNSSVDYLSRVVA